MLENEVCSSLDDSLEASNMDIDFLKMHVFQGVCVRHITHRLYVSGILLRLYLHLL